MNDSVSQIIKDPRLSGINFQRIEDYVNDSVRFYMNGVQVGYANHDEDGWEGMEKCRNLFDNIAKQLHIEVVETDAWEDDPVE